MKNLEMNIREILSRHIGTTCTAAVLRVQCGETVILDLAGGTTDLENGNEITVAAPFDLASITKVFTASAVLRLVNSGVVDLDDPVAKHLHDFDTEDADHVNVRHLLTHSSGLLASHRLFQSEGMRTNSRMSILERPLVARPGSVVVYGDVGFMTLGLLVEEVAGLSLSEAMQSLVLEPLGIEDVSFGPCPGAPATEYDVWRGRRVQGEVHDENAAALGGVAGHAGLFGSAGSVARLALAFASTDSGFLVPELIWEATRLQMETGNERRGLGWKLASPDPEAPESVFSPAAFGHYGFTGTAVWSDPEVDMSVVLLTNRVYFGRDAAPIRRLRREVFEMVAKECRGTQ